MTDATDAFRVWLLRFTARLRDGRGAYVGKDERVTHPICVDCAIQTEPAPNERDHYACDSCGLVVDALAASPARRAGC